MCMYVHLEIGPIACPVFEFKLWLCTRDSLLLYVIFLEDGNLDLLARFLLGTHMQYQLGGFTGTHVHIRLA